MKKEEKIEALVNFWAETIDLDDLIAYFKDKQREELKKMSIKELNETYKQNILGDV